MKRQIEKPSFNLEWAIKKGKVKFVNHFKTIYPNIDLGAEYDKLIPPPKEKL